MNTNPPPSTGSVHWFSKVTNSPVINTGLPWATNTGLLAFVAPLLQAEVGYHVWLWGLLGAVALITCYILSVSAVIRAPSWVFALLFFLLISGVGVVLAIRPFYGQTGRVYVAVTGDNLSLFDVKRYISSSYTVNEKSSLLEANHPAHRWVAGVLHESSPNRQGERRWASLIEWLGSMGRGTFFHGEIRFLDAISRRGDRVVPMHLDRLHMEGWTDLSGSPCKSYRFELASDRLVSFELGLAPTNQTEDGRTRLGTGFKMNFAPQYGATLKFSSVWRKEAIQWEDVALFSDYDSRTARYIAHLSEMFTTPDLRQQWALCQDTLWDHVPNDRERLRLLQLRANLDSVVSSGNIMHAQLLPDLIRMETLLATAVDSAEDLVHDQFLNQSMKKFIELSRPLKRLFNAKHKTFEKYIIEARPALDPVCLKQNGQQGVNDLVVTISRALPTALLEQPWLKSYVDSFKKVVTDTPDTEPTPLNVQLAWMKNASWESLRQELPKLKLPARPAEQVKRGLTRAQWALLTESMPGLMLMQPVLDLSPSTTTAAEQAQSPTREDAWEVVETAFSSEWMRRALTHAEAAIIAAGQNFDDQPLGEAVIKVLEGMLLQQELINQHLDLRESLFGDRDAYLADSLYLSYFQKASQTYGDGKVAPLSTAVAQQRLLPIFSMLNMLLRGAQLVGFVEDGLVDELASLQKLLATDARMLKITAAMFSTLDPQALTQMGMPWMIWLGTVSADPTLAKLAEAFIDGGDYPEVALIAGLGQHLGSMPVDASVRETFQTLLTKSTGFYAQALRYSEDAKADPQEVSVWMADAILEIRQVLLASKVLLPLGELMTEAIYAENLSWFKSLEESDQKLAASVMQNLRTRLPRQQPDSSLSDAEKRLRRFVTDIAWLSHLKGPQRPVAIVRHEATGTVAFDPPCPELESWIRRVVSKDSNARREGQAYPYIAEALLLDLYLRALEDRVPGSYLYTEFGRLRSIFESLTQRTAERYIAECLLSEKEQKEAPQQQQQAAAGSPPVVPATSQP